LQLTIFCGPIPHHHRRRAVQEQKEIDTAAIADALPSEYYDPAYDAVRKVLVRATTA